MNILWFSWKDCSHPLAGGAELVKEELAKRLAADGHKVKLVVGTFPGGATTETRNGYEIIRLSNPLRLGVYLNAFRYYRRHLRGWADLVVEEINTIPFFTRFYVREKTVLFVHQLAREIWFHQMIFPMSVAGHFLEPLYLGLLSKQLVITVSESTKADLVRFGFDPERISIISEGITLKALETLESVQKYAEPTVLALGAIRGMKQTLHAVEAFEIAKKRVPGLRLMLAGASEDAYAKKVARAVTLSPYTNSIQTLGKVTAAARLRLLQKSHVLVSASLKEGWGLTITEAASQGTPAVVYNADGLRDSVQDGITGLVTRKNTPQDLAEGISSLFSNPSHYERLRQAAWQTSKEITFEKSYSDFLKAISAPPTP